MFTVCLSVYKVSEKLALEILCEKFLKCFM